MFSSKVPVSVSNILLYISASIYWIMFAIAFFTGFFNEELTGELDSNAAFFSILAFLIMLPTFFIILVMATVVLVQDRKKPNAHSYFAFLIMIATIFSSIPFIT